jgi:tRNA G37 N-methylase Trm5
MMTPKFEIDIETVDRITLLALKDQKEYLKKELKRHRKGEWMHPEDVVYNTQLLEALKIVIDYYGG